MNRPPGFALRLAAITLAGLALMLAWQTLPLLHSELLGWRAQPREVTPRGDLAEDERSTIELFETRSGSVVFITTVQRAINPWTGGPLDVRSGTGTGFVWDQLGHIVTNHHVIAGASQALVSLPDGRSFDAVLVGSNPENDLAVLRIGIGVDRPEPLPIGTSADLRVGQKVFAIGNPFGLDQTLTTGIVSALNRDLPVNERQALSGLIQTDAAINPGNSGGPLLDSAGRLIGVNTAIYSPSGASAGIGFAVPVDKVNQVVPRLIATGHYVGADLGVRADPAFNEALSARLGVEGVFVLDVVPGSTADRAGLQPARLTRDGGFQVGDIIVSLDDRPTPTPDALAVVLSLYNPGDEIELSVVRNGRVVESRMVLGASA